MATKLTWHNEKRRAGDIFPCDRNPNVNDDKQFRKLKESIKRDGYVEIIVIDTDGTIVAGAHRHQALMEMGMADREVDVRVPNRKLTKEEFDRYLIASNALKGSWDYSALSKYFAIDTLVESGLSDDDISRAFADALEVRDDDFDTAAEIKKIKTPKTKLGDYYELGPHRLACIDSRDKKAVQKLLGSERIDLVDVDPPFNINWSYKGKNGKYGGSYQDDKSDKEYRIFLESLIGNALSVAKKDTHFLFWGDQNYIGMLQGLYQELGIDHKRVCLWIKNNQNPTPQTAFHKCYEAAVYGTIGKPFLSSSVLNVNEVMNKELGTGNELIDGILDLLDLWLVKRLPGNKYSHPTEKRPSLHEKILRRCSKPGDSVLDLCAGSGSIMVASDQLKRKAFLSEVDPVFCDLIIRRYEKLTGLKAKKIHGN